MTNDRATVLIADDDSAITELLSDLLSERYKVCLVNNGDDALYMLNNNDNHFDLLLLDIMMPRLNGYQVLSKINNSFLPVLILSAKSDPLDQIKGLSLGAWGYSTKPFNKDMLMTQIQNLIRLGQLLRIHHRQLLDEKKKRAYAEQRLFTLKQDLAGAKDYILKLKSKKEQSLGKNAIANESIVQDIISSQAKILQMLNTQFKELQTLLLFYLPEAGSLGLESEFDSIKGLLEELFEMHESFSVNKV